LLAREDGWSGAVWPSVSLGGGSEQLSLVEVEPSPGRRRRTRYVHAHTPEELAAFERSRAIIAQIRGDGLRPDEKWCPGGCGKLIRRDRLVRPAACATRLGCPQGVLRDAEDDS